MRLPAAKRLLRRRSPLLLAHRWTLLLIVAALLAWLWGVFFWYEAQRRRELLADRGGELVLLANAVAQQSAGLLKAVESNLRLMDLWLLSHPGADPLRDPRFMLIVEEIRRSSGGLIDPRLVSADGQLYYLPSPDGKPRADVQDRGYYRVHLDGAGHGAREPLQIGDAVLSRVTGRWSIPVSLRLSPVPPVPGRPTMLVLFAAIELERLAAEHERMRFQPDGTIMLSRDDGTILSRTPMVDTYIGRNLNHSPQYVAEFGRQPRGWYVGGGAVTDGVKRLIGYQQLPGFPVRVLVTRTLDQIDADLDQRQAGVRVLSVMLTLAVIGVTLFLHRSQTSERALQSAQERLRRLATTDELTQVMNRRAFLEAALRELERAQRYHRPAAVLVLDLDHFKQVNDEYGHAGGDLVLQAGAMRWRKMLREQDLLGRLGGEEFCVLLPETDAARAWRVAERLRVITEATPMLGNRLRMTVSIGWTTVEGGDAGWPQVFERADQALYRCKNAGRNRVCPPGPTPDAAGPPAADPTRAEAGAPGEHRPPGFERRS